MDVGARSQGLAPGASKHSEGAEARVLEVRHIVSPFIAEASCVVVHDRRLYDRPEPDAAPDGSAWRHQLTLIPRTALPGGAQRCRAPVLLRSEQKSNVDALRQ